MPTDKNGHIAAFLAVETTVFARMKVNNMECIFLTI
jgi:hypothetical protein